MTIQKLNGDKGDNSVDLAVHVGNKDTMPLDSRIKYENDNSEFSCHSGLRAGIQRDDNLMPKAFRFAQSGRSIVEMLGVLAIMGVLGIGSIVLIKNGLIKQAANDIIHDITLGYSNIYTSMACNTNKTPITFESKSQKNIQTACFDDIRFVFVKDIPQDVCYKILEFKGINNLSIYTEADMKILSNCAENNNLAFSFNKELFCSGTTCGGDCCYSGQTCLDEACVSCPTTIPENSCSVEMDGCPTLKKLTGEVCADNKVCSSKSTCTTCPYLTSPSGLGGQIGYRNSEYIGCFCNNANEIWDSSTQSCVSCPTENSSGQGQGQLTATAGCYCNQDTPYYSKDTDTCSVCPNGTNFVGRECIFTNDNCNGVKCAPGTYCNISPDGGCQGGSYSMKETATCSNIPSYTLYTSPKYGKFALGNTNVTYWNANNICEALNGRMFTESDSGCSGLGAADTGLAQYCSNQGWTSSDPGIGSIDDNGIIQGCGYSEKMCELYHLGNFNKTSWIGNSGKEGIVCQATRMVFPGGYYVYKNRNQASYTPFCVLND